MTPNDPFARPSTEAVRSFVMQIVSMLATKYRVELKWDDPARVNLPNGSFLVGIPRSEIRRVYTVTLPAWATPSQIYGMIDAELQWALKAKRGNWIARAWRYVSGEQAPNPLAVPEPKGLFFPEKFSAQG